MADLHAQTPAPADDVHDYDVSDAYSDSAQDAVVAEQWEREQDELQALGMLSKDAGPTDKADAPDEDFAAEAE